MPPPIQQWDNMAGSVLNYPVAFTPTRSAEVNMDGNVSMTACIYRYDRDTGVVFMSGEFTADPTTTTTATSFEFDLPVSSNIGQTYDLCGVAFCGGVAGQGAQIRGVVANNTAKVTWVAGDVTSKTWSYVLQYRVI